MRNIKEIKTLMQQEKRNIREIKTLMQREKRIIKETKSFGQKNERMLLQKNFNEKILEQRNMIPVKTVSDIIY